LRWARIVLLSFCSVPKQVLFLDAKEEKYVEEAGASNFFCITSDGTIHTPPLRGTILPGVTRQSLLHLAREKGIQVDWFFLLDMT